MNEGKEILMMMESSTCLVLTQQKETDLVFGFLEEEGKRGERVFCLVFSVYIWLFFSCYFLSVRNRILSWTLTPGFPLIGSGVGFQEARRK